ncbi:odorant receptor 33b-like [Teleopsis dalmanni]|uniref:odorant receptor 33b-like n=1 Tax=Teleopsis dalmanni TaxID=139649 RepID=UPI0018CC9FBA|nr:odorant receptor 33b-like [Teleopsis dalmanni]
MALELDTNDASRYIWKCWHVLGLHPTNKYRNLYWCYAGFIFLAAVWHPFHLLLQMFFIGDFIRVINNLSISLTLLCATAKHVIMFYFTRVNLQKARTYFRKLDEHAKTNVSERDMLNAEVRFCHRLYYCYIVTYLLPLIAYSVLGYYQHSLLFEGWFPFDWTANEGAYYLAYGSQVFGTSITFMQNLTCDTCPIIYLLIALAHLRVIKSRMSRMGNVMFKSNEERYEELAFCVSVYEDWMQLFLSVRPVVSVVMGTQFTVTAFVACFSAVTFMDSQRSLLQVTVSTTYLMCILVEVLPCCWCVNELIAETRKLTSALYSCNWYQQNTKFRRALIIFMTRSQQEVNILAGNIVPVTLQTFISMVKFSFSMYTLLNEIRE